MNEQQKYRRQKHINAVLKNSGARYSVQAILMAMCGRSEFDQPTVTITKREICSLIGGLYRVYIMRGLRELEETGVIEVVRNGQGGRGVAPTYRLKVRRVESVPEAPYEVAPEHDTSVKKDAADQIMKEFGYGFGQGIR